MAVGYSYSRTVVQGGEECMHLLYGLLSSGHYPGNSKLRQWLSKRPSETQQSLNKLLAQCSPQTFRMEGGYCVAKRFTERACGMND